MGIRLTTDADLTSIANAIRTKGGTNASLSYPTGFVNAIGAIQSGSSGGSKGDVTFYDYDGTIVTSYSAAEFANLSALPANPTHSGLTAQGWNWSLADAKTHVAMYGKLNIGQMYVTDDGKTRLYIHIADVARNVVPLYWWQNESNGVTINWGDGSTEETFNDTGDLNTTHTYASTGDYVITLDVTSGTAKLGYGSSGYAVLGTTNNDNTVYRNMLRKVEIGNNMDLYSYAFYKCYSLKNITLTHTTNSYAMQAGLFQYCYSLNSIIIPDSVTSIESSAFDGCRSLSSITISDSVTSTGSNAFSSCYPLTSITIPNSMTNIGTSTFNSCQSLASIIIPDGVTNIGSNTFQYCYGIKEYHLFPVNPPVLNNTNAFGGISSDCIIYVPYSADHSILEAYKTASNWSDYASYMQEEPQS